MRDAEMQPDDVERKGDLIGLRVAAGHAPSIVTLLTEIRTNVLRKALALRQDAPLAIYFDAR
jgi:hypothetical protein